MNRRGTEDIMWLKIILYVSALILILILIVIFGKILRGFS